MERTKNKEQEEDHEGMIRWRKTGGGSFRMKNGRIIKPNQVFWAAEEDIPQGFRDNIKPLTPTPETKNVQAQDAGYEIKERPNTPEIVSEPEEQKEEEFLTVGIQQRSVGWYDIVDGEGKVLNEKGLRKAEAEKMLEDLK